MFSAAYYDGKTARRHAVEVTVTAGTVTVSGLGVQRCEPLSSLRISERLGQAPRLLSFGDGAYCEVRDHAALEAALGAAGHRLGLVERLQHSWRAAVLALALCGLGAFAAYRWGLPWAAEEIALRLPAPVSQQLSDSTLQALDRIWLQPSQLSAARRQVLADGFARLQVPDAVATARIEFRSSPKIGPNAFALPDGRVVLLDQLVALAKDDAEIEAVLAHELGHVRYRHGLRMLLQGSTVGLVMTAWFGDVSTLLATVPTVLLQTRYSRAFETEADDYATRMLLANGIAPSHLADLLERMEAQRNKPDKDGKRAKDDKNEAETQSYLSTHPATAERISRLRAADAALPSKRGDAANR